VGLAENHRRAEETRAARDKGFVETMYQVERSAVPLPDKSPIRYPNAETWQRLLYLGP
jgi:hypothetical protein